MADERLQEVIQIEGQIARIKDLDLLLERILTEVRRFVRADAGSIYLKVDGQLEFSYTQNDTLRQRLPAGQKLIYDTFSLPIDNTSIAGYAASQGVELNIADVYEIPASAPYSFGKAFDEKADYRTRSMFTLPLKIFRGDTVGVLQVINAHDEDGNIASFSPEDALLIHHFANGAAVAIERAQMTRTIFLRMISMTELRDPKETGPHVSRVASYSTELYEVWARRQKLAEREIERQRDVLRSAAMLHDVGKVSISDTILKKPGPLTDEEYATMKEHTIVGAQLFADPKSEIDEAAVVVALNHHERWDGGGYPHGKSGDEIPLFGRLVAVADVYDALCSRRSYKEAWAEDEVLAELKKNSGSQFDPEIIADFVSIYALIQSIKARYPEADI